MGGSLEGEREVVIMIAAVMRSTRIYLLILRVHWWGLTITH